MASRPLRNLARQAASAGNLESRSKMGWGSARAIDEIAPQFRPLTQAFDDLLHGLHKAEGQQLDYDGLKKERIEFESFYKNMDRASENVLNAKLGGSKVDWPPNSNISHENMDKLLRMLEAEQIRIAELENLEFERLGLATSESLEGVSREYHPRFQSTTTRNPFTPLRNAASAIKGVPRAGLGQIPLPKAVRDRFPGMTSANFGRMADSIGQWLEGNASFDGSKIVWREGKGRGWWNGKGGTHSVVTPDGRQISPDNIDNLEDFNFWMANEPARLSLALLEGKSKLSDESQRLDENLETALTLPHLGETVHSVSVIDMLRNAERSRRVMQSIQKLPDGFFAKMDELGADLAAERVDLQNIYMDKASGTVSPEMRAAAKELDDLFAGVQQAIGIRGDGKTGSLYADAMEVIGRPQNGKPHVFSQAISDIDSQLADYINKAYIKYNISSGLRQEGQAFFAKVAAGDATGLKNYVKSRTKALPLISKFAKSSPDVLQNTHSVPDRGGNAGWDQGFSEFRRQLRLQANGTEQIEAASIDGFMRTLGEKVASPDKALSEYLERVIGRDGADELRAAFASGDFAGAYEIARPLVIRELDQINGSGVSTSKPTLLKSTTGARLLSRLVSTPLTVTGSILGANDRYGARASSNPALAKAGALAILGGGQLLSNAALIADPKIAGAMSLAMGSYMPFGWYAFRATNGMETQEEMRAKGKLETIGHMAGSLAGGNPYSGLALGAAALAESVPTKFSSSSDIITGQRSKTASQFAQSAPSNRVDPFFDTMAGLSPTVVGIPKMGMDLWGMYRDYGISGAFSDKLPIPLARTAFAAKENPKDMRFESTKVAPAVETMNWAKKVDDAINRRMKVAISEE